MGRLHDAVKAGDPDRVVALLGEGLDPGARDDSDLSPLDVAAVAGHVEVATLLLDHGAAPSAHNQRLLTPLHLAVLAERLGVARVLLERKAEVDSCGFAQPTPLAFAAHLGNSELVGLLLSRGADACLRDPEGNTPAEVASTAGHTGIAALLRRRASDSSEPGGTPRVQRFARGFRRRYRIGEHHGELYGWRSRSGLVVYWYVLALFRKGGEGVDGYIASESSGPDPDNAPEPFLCVYQGGVIGSGSSHSNHGCSADWADLGLFGRRALVLATELLGVPTPQTESTPRSLSETPRPDRPWWRLW